MKYHKANCAKQMVWHAYHAGSLCQLVNLGARQEEIEEIKPEHELPTRRRLMKSVAGELPEEFVSACEAAQAARESREAAWESREAAREAWEASYTKHKTEIERLHAIECSDCPWDGETIFPEQTE